MMWNSLVVAWRALAANVLRSTLTMLGIIFGVGAVISTIAIGAGAERRIQEQIRAIGANLIVVGPGSGRSGAARMGYGSRPTITEADARAIAAEVPGVVAAAPTLRGNGRVVFGNANWSTSVLGVTPDYFAAREWRIRDGSAFADEHVEGARKVALLGQTVAERLFGETDPVDKVVRIDKVPFTVLGVLARKGQTMGGQDQDDTVLLPLSTARNRVLGRSAVNARSVTGITVKLADGRDMAAAEEAIRAVVRARHKLRPGQDDDFSLRNIAEILQAQEDSSRVMKILLASVASVSLLVGGIGIMNIMLVSVTERTREIGLRMAVGARGRDILAQFLVEAVTLAGAGGVVGALLGIAGSLAIGRYGEFAIAVEPTAIAVALAFAGTTGLVFGLLPATKAAGLQPIEALRHE